MNRAPAIPRQYKLLLAALGLAVIVSSFSIVITRHHVRMAFMGSEELLMRQDELQMRWESLQLERSALRTEGRVEAIAKHELGMKIPERDEVVTLIVKGERG